MKKVVAILLVLLVGCQFSALPKKKPVPVELAVGTSALEVSFNPASMSNILMCQEADVLVGTRNAGVFDVQDGTYALIAEEQVLTPLGDKQRAFSLAGRSQFNPPGGFDQVVFKLKSVGLPEQLESYSSPAIFQACYRYKTFAAGPVCIDPDVRNLNPRKPCRTGSVVLAGGQGAPVAVTKVESVMVPEGDRVKPVFSISVQHLGTGSVITEEGVAVACTSGREAGELLASLAKVDVRLQNRKLTCSPEPVRLEAGKESRVVCEGDELYNIAQGTFSSILSIELSYGYVSTAVLPMTITRLPGQKAC